MEMDPAEGIARLSMTRNESQATSSSSSAPSFSSMKASPRFGRLTRFTCIPQEWIFF